MVSSVILKGICTRLYGPRSFESGEFYTAGSHILHMEMIDEYNSRILVRELR